MTIKQYFAARHSSGSVHLRATNGHGSYKFAVVRTRAAGGASFSSRRDLAEREAEQQRRWHADVEVVPCAEIERAEYNAMLKAGAIKQVVTFRCKKFSKTTKADSTAIPTHAVGVFKAAHETRVDIQPDWHPSYLEKYPEGFFMSKQSEVFRVCWYHREAEAQKAVLEYTKLGYQVELFTL